MLSEIKSGRERQTPLMFHSYVDPEKLNRTPWVMRRGKKSYREGSRETMRLLNTENNLRVDWGWGRGESGSWALTRAPVGMSTGFVQISI